MGVFRFKALGSPKKVLLLLLFIRRKYYTNRLDIGAGKGDFVQKCKVLFECGRRKYYVNLPFHAFSIYVVFYY
jgi:hypothetical protein